jgi:hypothetical protein
VDAGTASTVSGSGVADGASGPREELQAYIREDKSISDMVRKQALDWAEWFWKNRQTEKK